MKLALVNGANDAIELYPATRGDLQSAHPLVRFPRELTDETLLPYKAVLVREIDPPPSVYGDIVSDGPPEKQADGHWHQTWIVTTPTTEQANAIRAALRELAESTARTRLDDLSALDLATIGELYRYEADATPTAAEYPLLMAVSRGAGLTPAQTVTAVRNRYTPWFTRAALVQERLADILQRIAAATTLEEAKAIYEELESL